MKRAQKGVTLVGMAIAVLIAGLLTVSGLLALQALQEENTAANLANGLTTADNAISSYATIYYSQLVNSQPVCAAGGTPCVASPLAPTSAELKTLGILPSNFQSTAYTGGQWQFQVLLTPVGCSATTCNVSWEAYLNTPPKTTSGAVDVALVGDAANRAGISAGYSSAANPTVIEGLRGAWTQPNPQGAQAGILMAMGSYNSSQFSVYLPRSGALPMTGNLDLGTHNINNVGSVNASAGYNVTGGGQFTSDQGGSLELGGNNSTAGSGTPYIDFHLSGQGVQDYNARIINDSNGHLTFAASTGEASLSAGNISADSLANTFGTNGTSQFTATNPGNGPAGIALNSNAGTYGARIQTNPTDSNTLEITDQSGTVLTGWNGSNMTVSGSIRPELSVSPAAACSTPGAMGQNVDGSGQILVCQYGVWTPLGGWDVRIGHYDVGGSFSNLVPIPYCGASASATPLVDVSIEGFSVDTTATVNTVVGTSGSNYSINFTDGSGASIYSTVRAVAVTYCNYGTP